MSPKRLWNCWAVGSIFVQPGLTSWHQTSIWQHYCPWHLFTNTSLLSWKFSVYKHINKSNSAAVIKVFTYFVGKPADVTQLWTWSWWEHLQPYQLQCQPQDICYADIQTHRLVAWHSSNALCRINKVALRWAQLVLGWVTVYGQVTISVRNQPARSTQPTTLRGMVKWVSAFGLSDNKWRWWM